MFVCMYIYIYSFIYIYLWYIRQHIIYSYKHIHTYIHRLASWPRGPSSSCVTSLGVEYSFTHANTVQNKQTVFKLLRSSERDHRLRSGCAAGVVLFFIFGYCRTAKGVLLTHCVAVRLSLASIGDKRRVPLHSVLRSPPPCPTVRGSAARESVTVLS